MIQHGNGKCVRALKPHIKCFQCATILLVAKTDTKLRSEEEAMITIIT